MHPILAITRRENLDLAVIGMPPNWRYRVLLPSEIEKWLVGKPKRDAVHNTVHAFRDACRVPYNRRDSLPKWYISAVDVLARAPVDCRLDGELKLIEKIATPDEYLKIRQCGRMRKSADSLSPQGLERLCKEIRVALMWSTLKFTRQNGTESRKSMSA